MYGHSSINRQYSAEIFQLQFGRERWGAILAREREEEDAYLVAVEMKTSVEAHT